MNWDTCAPGGVATISCLEPIFTNIVSAAATLAGIALFVWLTIGGFKYLTSGGDPKKLEEAKHDLTYAFLGFILIISAFLIINILATFFGGTLGDRLRNFRTIIP